jgi:hypothetical protein
MNHRAARFKAALFSLVLLAACDRWLTKPPLYNTLQVIATRRNGDPIPGVALALYTGQRPMGYGSTGSDGRLTFPNVPQGLYGLLATPPAGYDVIENLVGGPSSLVVDNLHVAADTVSPVRFSFLKRGPGTVTVRVVQPDGSPIPGAVVTAYGTTKIDGNATSDANGRAVFSQVAFGVHGVVVTRPLLYRLPGDSLYSIHDGIIVEDGSQDSVVFRLQKCTGTVQALVLDNTGVPVPGTTAVFYTAAEQLAISATGADGRVTFAQAPCTEVGVLITPAPGYSVQEGRGFRFIDGLKVTNGATLNVTFRVQRTR